MEKKVVKKLTARKQTTAKLTKTTTQKQTRGEKRKSEQLLFEATGSSKLGHQAKGMETGK